MAQFSFDARNVQPDTGVMDPVPAGWYNVMADQSDIKPTNDGLGAYLEIRFNIMDGQYVGRKLFSRFNIKNGNQQAVDIGYKQLSAFQHAIGVLVVQQDTSELHGKPLKVKVSVRPGNVEKDAAGNVVKQYEPSNDIKAYRNINEQVDQPKPGAVNMAQATAPAGYGQPQGAPQGFGVPGGTPAPQQWQQPPQAPAMPPQQPMAPQQAPQQWQAPPQQPMQQPMQQPPMQQPMAPQQPWMQAPAQGMPQQQPMMQPPMQQPATQMMPPPQTGAGGPLPPWQQPR